MNTKFIIIQSLMFEELRSKICQENLEVGNRITTRNPCIIVATSITVYLDYEMVVNTQRIKNVHFLPSFDYKQSVTDVLSEIQFRNVHKEVSLCN